MKFLLIGSFSFEKMDVGGQPVKSRELFYTLSKMYGEDSVAFVDSYVLRHRPILLFLKTLLLSIKSEAIIMLPAHNGVKVFSRLLAFVKMVFRKRIYYDVIGGWLNELLDEKPGLTKTLRRFDCVFVETSVMKTGLEKKCIRCRVLPNFKSLEPVVFEKPFIAQLLKPFKLCLFSRVTEGKGIKEAIEAVKHANENGASYLLDIYGPVEEEYERAFSSLKGSFPNYIAYKGTIPSNKSVDILKDYFALLFPTKFFTEGIPGTIIDAYFAGLPVIASRWLNFSEVIKEGTTGIGFAFNRFEELNEILTRVYKNPDLILGMKTNCIKESSRYGQAHAIAILKEAFEDGVNKKQ